MIDDITRAKNNHYCYYDNIEVPAWNYKNTMDIIADKTYSINSKVYRKSIIMEKHL